MPRNLRWTELRGGIISAAAVLALVLGTLIFARVGTLRGKKVTLYVLATNATGVMSGTEVWLAGKHSGSVTKISFLSPSSDTVNRLLIKTEFLASDLSHVRRDSWAQVQAGGSFFGAPVIYVAPGSATSPALRDGDTIRSRPKPQVAEVTGQATRLKPEFQALRAEVAALNKQLSDPRGSVGAYRARGMPALSEAAERVSRVSGKMTSGGSGESRGTIGLARSTDLIGKAKRVMAAVDSMGAFMASGKGSVGRFRRDSTLVSTAKGIIAQLDSLRARSKFGGADNSLKLELARRRILMDSLMTDIRKNPLRYTNF